MLIIGIILLLVLFLQGHSPLIRGKHSSFQPSMSRETYERLRAEIAQIANPKQQARKMLILDLTYVGAYSYQIRQALLEFDTATESMG